MWHTICYIFLGIYLFLIIQESNKKEKERWRLSSKCHDLEKENQKLKIGRQAYNIGDETVYFTKEEAKRYDKWHKFYDFDKMEKVGILTPDEELSIVITGILENKPNETILRTLISKSKPIK